MEQKPKVRDVGKWFSFLGWKCYGHKGDHYHVRYGNTWWEACRKWHEDQVEPDNEILF